MSAFRLLVAVCLLTVPSLLTNVAPGCRTVAVRFPDCLPGQRLESGSPAGRRDGRKSAADAVPPDPAVVGNPGSMDDLLNLDVDQLANAAVEVVVESTPAALTETPRNIVPATVTRITREDIYNSGARSLNELLDIYVPNLEWVRHHWENSHIGLRGIISDREDKYLLLVNNRIMNDKTHYGAISERDLVQLQDIDHIDVIRGPGSPCWGRVRSPW